MAVTATDDYSVSLESDDGSQLRIIDQNSFEFTLSNSGVHRVQTQATRLFLPAGLYYVRVVTVWDLSSEFAKVNSF